MHIGQWLRLFGPRGAAAGVASAFLAVLIIGLPTAVVPNRFFARMTPTRPQVLNDD